MMSFMSTVYIHYKLHISYAIILSCFTMIHFQFILPEENHEAIRSLLRFLFFFPHTGSMQLRSQLGYSFSITEGLFIGECDLT